MTTAARGRASHSESGVGMSSNVKRVSKVLAITACLAAGSLAGAGVVSAQSPDIRDVRPIVMLLVDTSGSMEYESGQPTGTLPTCSGSLTGVNERTRWATVLEALTGSWPSFTCTTVNRRATYSGAPDQYYYLPYHRPPNSGQLADGVLDVYSERVKFGLMTFDTLFGLTSVPDELMVTQSIFATRLLDNAGLAGDYSYGEPRPLTFPGCSTTFMVDGGARSPAAPYGQLVSVGTDADDYRVVNATIQSQLLTTRAYGATPTAAMLDDFRYYLQNHADVAPATGTGGDPFAACRARYAVLLTDGQPNDPYRAMGCAAAGYSCPYDHPSNIAADLCRYNAGSTQCEGLVDGVFVVGFEVGDPAAQAALDDIADRGGTGTAFMATDRLSLIASLSAAIDRAAPGTTTRTLPVFATASSSSTSGGGPQSQYLFNSGFEVSDEAGEPWSGVLDRTRFVCGADLVPARQPLDPTQDSFHEILNDRDVSASPRVLYTVATPDPSQMAGVILGTGASVAPVTGIASAAPPTRVTGLELTRFDTTNGALTPEHFALSGGTSTTRTARRDAIIDWVHGRAGTSRFENRFGDIYHSTPVTVGPPRSDLADESFNLFRRREDVATRPTVVYVGTNDGVLHAFATEEFRVGTRTLRAGEEIWGFVPPAVLSRLESATASHQILVDGPPVVRDVFYMRTPGQQPTEDRLNAASYRTVLVMGLRGGGNHYFALDITDPLEPRFLWQFTAREMGQTYARPAIAQVLVELGGVLQERAVALLPGGRGEIDAARATATGTAGCAPAGVGAGPITAGTTAVRNNQRCWHRTGRDLHWVDIATGETIHTIDGSVFNAPLTGGVSAFTGDVGTIATRAFLTDEDGVIWRVDFSSRRVSDWTARPFHDVFWDGGATTGQPGYDPPVITTDVNGNLVILQATGNIDQLESTAANRVVSLRECMPGLSAAGSDCPTGTTDVTASLNWEIRLRQGEQVTGPLDLYEGVTYFGTFESSSGVDACQYGQSRIWGVSYLEAGGTAPTGYVSVVPGGFPTQQIQTLESGPVDAHFIGPFTNEIVMGVQVTQQITCVTGDELPDPYLGMRYDVTGTGASQFQLTAQISGGSAPGTPGTSSVRSITRTLPAPPAYTRVLSWVPQADQ